VSLAYFYCADEQLAEVILGFAVLDAQGPATRVRADRRLEGGTAGVEDGRRAGPSGCSGVTYPSGVDPKQA
jgi:hypothetical protein